MQCNSSLQVQQRLHPQHEVRYEVAKWLVPILARAPGRPYTDFPASLVALRLSLARAQLEVLRVVEPGYSKARAKAQYEVGIGFFLKMNRYNC